MRIVITARELLDREIWIDFCEMMGVNEWAVNEGCIDVYDAFYLNEEQAQQLGLIK